MLTQIKKDLKDIRCYYSQLREIEIARETVAYDWFKKKVDLYNEAINKASPELYRIYTCFYVEGLSLDETAEELDLSFVTINRKNRLIKEYFVRYFTENNIDIKNLTSNK